MYDINCITESFINLWSYNQKENYIPITTFLSVYNLFQYKIANIYFPNGIFLFYLIYRKDLL